MKRAPSLRLPVLAALSLAVLLVATLVLLGGASAPAGAATLAPANGQGSTYAALAFQEWTQSVQNQGLNLNYTPTSSPAGLEAYSQNTADFAGTEAEFSELLPGQPSTPPRGFEYTPDVAGATAIMYNAALTASGQDPITSLRLSPMTIAKIFLGVINNWDDPAISADNGGVTLPNHPITVVCRTGQSGTTALFYDYVANTDPTGYATWVQQNGYPSAGTRLLEVDNANIPANMACQSGSDTEANYIAANRWTIGYDEFGYAKVYNDNVAWVQNASGNWVQPYAVNISAALQSAQLAPDTSQNLTGVYTSTNPLAYPISAYSYILGPMRAELSAFDVYLALSESGHRQHHGRVHGLRCVRRPGLHGPNRVRPAATTTVPVPGQRGRLDAWATGSAAERIELQQSHLHRGPRQRFVATLGAPDRQRTRRSGR